MRCSAAAGAATSRPRCEDQPPARPPPNENHRCRLDVDNRAYHAFAEPGLPMWSAFANVSVANQNKCVDIFLERKQFEEFDYALELLTKHFKSLIDSSNSNTFLETMCNVPPEMSDEQYQ